MDVFRPSHGKTGRWSCRAIHESPLRSRRIGVSFVGADIIRPPIHILARPIIVPPQELVQTHYNYRRAFHYF